MKSINVNMEDDVIRIVEQFFEDYQENVESSVFSCNVHSVKCDEINCKGITDSQSRLTLSLFPTVNEIKSEIEKIIRDALIESNQCNTCGKKLEPRFSFSNCIVLNVELENNVLNFSNLNEYQNLQNQAHSVKVNIRDIQKKIVINDIVYELKSVIDHPDGHFKSFYRISNNDYLEMDDSSHLGVEFVRRNHFEEINPKILLYIKCNENVSDFPVSNEISNIDSSKVKLKEEDFMICEIDDDIPVDLEYEEDNSDDEDICTKIALIPNDVTLSSTSQSYNSLCPYNSVLGGFIAACNFDKDFYEFVKNNRNKFEFFEIIIKLLKERSQENRNEIWIKFLILIFKDEVFPSGPDDRYPFKRVSHNSFSMIWDVISFYDIILVKKAKLVSCTSRLTCKCGYFRELKSSVIFVSSKPTIKSFVDSLNNLDSVIKEKHGKTCSKCNGQLKEEIVYNDFLVIFSSFGINRNVKIPLSKVPLSIVQNNERYNFKFLVNLIDCNNPALNHFDCYAFNESVKKFFHVDDVGQREKEISQPSLVKLFPKIMVYFKNH
jgi:hypothetical protein